MAKSKSSGGFIRAGIDIKPRLIVCTQAVPKSGKTHWYLTGPGPIAVIDIDDGIHRAIAKFQKEKEIYVAQYRRDFTEIRENDSAAATMKAAAEQLEKMRGDYIHALHEARTVAVDGGAELYETVRLACFGKTEKVLGREYGPVNREMKLWLDMARNSDANVIFTHRLRDKYVNDKKTGDLEMEGWKKMPYECDMVVQQWIEESEPIPQRYHLTVLSCGMNPELDGLDFSGKEADFATIAQMVFPETSAEDWQ